MTLPWSGPISLMSVNAEIGNGSGAMSLAWVRDHSYYAYRDLNSIHGLTWFQAVSSQNNVGRNTDQTVSNCGNNCGGRQHLNPTQSAYPYDCRYNPGGHPEWIGFDGRAGYGGDGGLTDCNPFTSTNCDQCGYASGPAMLQKNCNCNCNCWNCNCYYTNCNCANCWDCCDSSG